MRRLTGFLLALALVPVGATAQEPGQPRGGRAHMEAQQRRAELEREVRRRFMAQVERRLELSAGQRSRLQTLLEEGAEARRALAEEGRALRLELMEAVRSDDTPVPVYERLLTRIRELREREQALEDREAAALGEFLDARQQAIFLMMRMRLNEQIRGMLVGPPGGRRQGGG